MPKGIVFIVSLFLCVAALSPPPRLGFAGHPLITDDTGTQGQGGVQIEINGMFGHNDDGGVSEKSYEVDTILSYGLFDKADVVLGLPYQHIRTTENGAKRKERGISDISLEIKWRFFERDGLSLAFKPGVSFPTGNEKKGLGAGRVGFGPAFIVTQELAPWTLHLNLSYKRNENKLAERKDIWHASLASEFEVLKGLRLVANVGAERNTDRSSDTHPAFLIVGFIYSVGENVDLNFGLQWGLTKTESDYMLRPGVALRFSFR